MIKVSVRGLAKYMTSSPATQRRILRDYKYPDDPEPYAMRLYYNEARDCVEAFHRSANNRPWMRGKASDLDQLARLTSGSPSIRLRHNARAVAQYDANFGDRQFQVLAPVRLSLTLGQVRISASPDLHVREGRRERILRLDFAVKAPDPEQVKIVSQCIFEAAQGALQSIAARDVLYLDVARGIEHREVRARARLSRDIEAACQAIEAIWETIQPPR